MFLKIITYFFPVPLPADHEYHRRLRLVTYTILITAIFALFYVSVSWAAGYDMGMLIMLWSFLVYILLLFFLKLGLNVIKAANMFGLIGASAIAGCIFFWRL